MYCFYSCLFFFKQKTAYELRISDWSSDVCSSDLVQHVERGEERRRAVALVVVGHGAGAALLHGQAGLGAVERLDLALLVDRQHHGVGRRIDIQADDGRELLGEGRVVRQLEVPPEVRAEAESGRASCRERVWQYV